MISCETHELMVFRHRGLYMALPAGVSTGIGLDPRVREPWSVALLL
jgi:hypothetical protein